RPSHRTSPSKHRVCAWTRPPLAPRLPPSVLPPLASMPRSSALLCACSSTYPVPLSFAEIILSFVRKQGSRSVSPRLVIVGTDLMYVMGQNHDEAISGCSLTRMAEHI